MENTNFLDYIAEENKVLAEEFYDKINSQTAAQEFVTLKVKAKNDDVV